MKYLIWSHRHRQWWGPRSAGYTTIAQMAGSYTWESACDVLKGSLPGANVPISVDLVNSHLLAAGPEEVEAKLEQWRRL